MCSSSDGDPRARPRRRAPCSFAARVAPDQGDHALGEVAGPDLDADRHALQLPVDDPAAEASVDLRRRARRARRRPSSSRASAFGGLAGAVLVADEQHHDLDRREAGRDAQAGVVAVGT